MKTLLTTLLLLASLAGTAQTGAYKTYNRATIDNKIAEVLTQANGNIKPVTIAAVRSLTAAPTTPLYVTSNGGGVFIYDPTDTTSPDNTATVLVTAGGHRLKRQYSGAKNGAWWGLVGNGIADDTQAMTSVFNAFFATDTEEHFIIPVGTYRITSPIVITIGTSYRSKRKYMDFRGIIEISGAAATATALTIRVTNSQLLSNIIIDGISTQGGTNVLELDGGNLGSGFFYRSRFSNLKFLGFSGRGLTLKGNFFENEIINLNGECSNFTTGFPLFIDGSPGSIGTGSIGSLVMRDIKTSGGLNGIKQIGAIADFEWSGVTVLSAGREGINFEFAVAQVFTKPHLEDNWKSVTSMAAAGSGMKLIGNGTVINPHGGANYIPGSGYQRHLVEGFASGGNILIEGGSSFQANNEAVFYAQGNQVGSGFIVNGTTVRVEPFVGVKMIHTHNGILKATYQAAADMNFVAATPIINLDYNQGSYFTIDGLDAAGNITIANLVGRTPLIGETIRIAIRQASGALRFVSWGAGWKGAIPPFSATYSQGQVYEFTYTFDNWYYTGTGGTTSGGTASGPSTAPITAATHASAVAQTNALTAGSIALVSVAADESAGNVGTGAGGINPPTAYVYFPTIGLLQLVTY